MIKGSNIKSNLLVCTLICIFTTSFILNYLQIQKIEKKKNELDKVYSEEGIMNKSSKGYWIILEDLESKEYLNIKKIYNDTGNKNVIHADIEFQGELKILDTFLSSLKKNDSFAKLNNIKLKEQEKESYIGELSMDFYI
jgi:hypothetical protein